METFSKIVNSLKTLIVFAKNSIMDVWQNLEYAFVLQVRKNRTAAVGTSVLGGNIEIPATFYVYGT